MSCRGHVEVMQRSCTGHTEVIQRSCRGHVEVMQMSSKCHVVVMQRSCRGHADVTSIEVRPLIKLFAVWPEKKAIIGLYRHQVGGGILIKSPSFPLLSLLSLFLSLPLSPSSLSLVYISFTAIHS